MKSHNFLTIQKELRIINLKTILSRLMVKTADYLRGKGSYDEIMDTAVRQIEELLKEAGHGLS